jgi:Bax protein
MKKPHIVLTILAAVLLSASGRADEALVRPERIGDQPQPIPAFGEIMDVKEKKETFFAYMNAKVQVANDDVWAERLFILGLQERFESSNLQDEELLELTSLGAYYRVATPEQLDIQYFEKLLVRVDVVPASLALAQAANESGWGTSRFAREGRNFFGIWCYEAGCGIAPARRNAGAKHEVRKFSSVLEGVRAYLHNINTGGAYQELREIRAAIRDEGKKPSGKQVAQGLVRYSERGEEYITEISAMIRQNNLERFSVRRSVTPLNTTATQ